MRQFYMTFPKSHPVSDQLSWTHYRLLMKGKDGKSKNKQFYRTNPVYPANSVKKRKEIRQDEHD